jgi:hypothetical protein
VSSGPFFMDMTAEKNHVSEEGTREGGAGVERRGGGENRCLPPMSVIESITATWIFWLVVLACAGGFAAYALRPDPARFVAYLRETSRHRKFLPPAADVPKIAVIGMRDG